MLPRFFVQRRLVRLATGLIVAAGLAPTVSAEAPLHLRIDAAIGAGSPEFEAQAARPASDAEFLRRVTLDLIGRIPTRDEARDFLDDPVADKRRRTIDRLLANPEHARRMQRVVDRMLMERRGAKHVGDAEWRAFLFDSFTENKPWDQLVREVLGADGSDPATRPAAKFYLDRDGETNLITRDIGRLFLGRDLQCAQCHDHPLVDDYLQAHYYGILAYLDGSFVFDDKKTKPVFAEKVVTEVSFKSVFVPDESHKTGPRMLDGPLAVLPSLPEGKEYYVDPSSGLRPIPKFSRRELLASAMTDPTNRAFAHNIVNRLWALMMGRGLVEPVDMFHGENPPSHPELLELLAGEFVAMNYDVKEFLRELALSGTYQRSSELSPDVTDSPPERFAAASMKPLSPEQLGLSVVYGTGLADIEWNGLDAAWSKLDPKFHRLRRQDARWRERALSEKLRGNLGSFIKLFATPPGQAEGPYQATVEQALFLRNGSVLDSWLAPRAGNLVDRLSKFEDLDRAAEEMYLQILSRRPSRAERREFAEFLAERPQERPGSLKEYAWALFASAEFRFNH